MRALIRGAIVVALLLVSAAAAPAAADDGVSYGGGVVGPSGTGDDPVVWAGSSGDGAPVGGTGTPGSGATPPSGAYRCVLTDGLAEVTAPVVGTTYLEVCFDGTEVVSVREVIASATSTDLRPPAWAVARWVARLLPLPRPHVHLAPDAGAVQLTGLRTWFWLDPHDLDDVTAEAGVPGISVTATARAVAVRWSPGDGTADVVCEGPGTPYDPAVADGAQHTACGHAFVRAGSLVLRVEVDWDVTWEASDGSSGRLPLVQHAAQVPIRVASRQAVITG